MIITYEFLCSGGIPTTALDGHPRYAWNKKQAVILGLKWPFTAGWMSRLIGTEITDEQAVSFVEAKGDTAFRRAYTRWVLDHPGQDIYTYNGKLPRILRTYLKRGKRFQPKVNIDEKQTDQETNSGCVG